MIQKLLALSLSGTGFYLLYRGNLLGIALVALGAGVLAISLIASSFADLLFDDFADDLNWFQYMLLLDGLLFAAAVMRQTFGLRDERKAALAGELEAVQEQARLNESLLKTREDRDRARSLAEVHRNRIALASHDLRQPLTSLRLAVEAADTSDTGLGDTLRTNLAYLKGLLDTTLADSAPDAIPPSGHAPPKTGYEDVPLGLVFQNAVHMFGDEARNKGIELSFEETEIVVTTDPIALIRIVANLTSNAVKYTTSGSVTLFVQQEGAHATVHIRDTGTGLSAAEIDQILQPYERGASSEGVDGDGLGLASVQVTAASLGLTLSVESTPGGGSTFTIAGLVPVLAGGT